MKKALTTPVTGANGRSQEVGRYDHTRLAAPCADDRCGGCQEPSCSHSCGHPHRAGRSRATRR